MVKRTVVGSIFPALVVGALFLGAAGDALAAHRTSGGGGRAAMRSTGGTMRSAPSRGVAVRPGSPPVHVNGHATYGYHGNVVVHGHPYHGGHFYGGWYWPYFSYYWPYYYRPYYYGYGYYGYPYGPPPASPYPPTYDYGYDDSGGGSAQSAPAYGPPAQVETDVSPGKAIVRVDGEDVGQAKDYDGRWDQLSVDAGPHTLEFEAEGYKTLRLDINI